MAGQTLGEPAVHMPDRHVSVSVQAFASSHSVPSGFVGKVHAPLAGSQLPSLWQGSGAVHATGVVPAHAPD